MGIDESYLMHNTADMGVLICAIGKCTGHSLRASVGWGNCFHCRIEEAPLGC